MSYLLREVPYRSHRGAQLRLVTTAHISAQEQVEPGFRVSTFRGFLPVGDNGRVRDELAEIDENLAAAAADVLPIVSIARSRILLDETSDAPIEVLPRGRVVVGRRIVDAATRFDLIELSESNLSQLTNMVPTLLIGVEVLRVEPVSVPQSVPREGRL